MSEKRWARFETTGELRRALRAYAESRAPTDAVAVCERLPYNVATGRGDGR